MKDTVPECGYVLESSTKDSIRITKPDKGNGMVMVNKLDYLNKMKQKQKLQSNKKNMRHEMSIGDPLKTPSTSKELTQFF